MIGISLTNSNLFKILNKHSNNRHLSKAGLISNVVDIEQEEAEGELQMATVVEAGAVTKMDAEDKVKKKNKKFNKYMYYIDAYVNMR